MEDIFFLGKLGEISLKKGNKKYFEKKLIQNLSELLGGAKAKIRVSAGRLFLQAPKSEKQRCEKALSHLIGITAWAEMSVVEKTLEAIIECCKQKATEAKDAGAKTFKIEVRRGDKTFPLNSYEIAQRVGYEIHNNILQTNVHSPDTVITIEVRDSVFIYRLAHDCFRGLPCGVSGKGLLLLSGGIDSPVAGFKMLTRGLKLECIYFHSYPYTSKEAQEKVESLAKQLSKFGLSTTLHIISFTQIQQRIKEKVEEQYFTLMMRICMMKIASIIAKQINASCLITGESLGQVASQTVENLTVTNTASDLLVLRPLIGIDKQEITDIAIRIGTYPISILPYPDCCVLFSPRHPSLHTDLNLAFELFETMEVSSLLHEAVAKCEAKQFKANFEN